MGHSASSSVSFLFTGYRNRFGIFYALNRENRANTRTKQEGNRVLKSQLGEQSRLDKIIVSKWVHGWISLTRMPKGEVVLVRPVGRYFSGGSVSVVNSISTLEDK